MTSSPTLSLTALCARAYAEAYAYHGDLNLDAEAFGHRLHQVVDHHLEPDADQHAALLLFEKLHKNDLYLTTACAASTEAAWGRFLQFYCRYVNDQARLACGRLDLSQEVADFVLTNLCLPDRQGRLRIGSYEGLGSLAAWLRVLVVHHAYRECQRKCHQFEPLDELPDVPDLMPLARLEATMRDRTYREVVNAALADAIGQLSPRERLILRLRYQEGLRGEEVARVIRVSPSTVSRDLNAAQAVLKRAVVAHLRGNWEDPLLDLKECLTDLLENPHYSLLTLLAETESA